MRSVRTAPTPEPAGPAKCDACGQTGEPVENAIRDGVPLLICEDPSECRRRAERNGIWKKA